MHKRFSSVLGDIARGFLAGIRLALFPLGIVCIVIGVGMCSIPAACCVAGIAGCVIGWAVE